MTPRQAARFRRSELHPPIEKAKTAPKQPDWQRAIEATGDPTARRNQMHNIHYGTERFREWSKQRLADLRARAQAITAQPLQEA